MNANYCIEKLKLTTNYSYERELNKAIEFVKKDSGTLKRFSGISIKTKTDFSKISVVPDIIKNKPDSFFKDFNTKLNFLNKKISTAGACRFNIGSENYISYFEKRVFCDKAVQCLKNRDYSKAILDSAYEIAGMISDDIQAGIKNYDYIFKEEADCLSKAISQLKNIGISTHRYISDKLGKLSYDRYSENLIVLNAVCNEIKQDIMQEFGISSDEPYNKKLVELSGKMPTQDMHYARNSKNDIILTKVKAAYSGYDPHFGIACHQFGTSEDWFDFNTKFVKGNKELIFDKNGNLVKDPRDMGTYNFAPFTPLDKEHYILDVLPWFIWGNSPEDNIKVSQRINSYRNPFIKEK